MSEYPDDIEEKLNPLSYDSDEEKDPEDDIKHQRLAGRPPLQTILYLGFGPLMSQVSGTLYGFINSWWVAQVMGEVALTAVAMASSFDLIGRAFGMLLSVAASSKISALFALGKDAECTQIICDLLRVSIIFGILVPSVLGPTVNLAMKWFGATQEEIDLGFYYIIPVFLGSVFICMFLTLSGSLQAEGRTTFVGVSTLAALLFSVCALTPLLLFVLKWGMFGAGFSSVVGETLIFFFFFFRYFRGKFNVKPKFNQFFKKFSVHTIAALKVGTSQFFSNLSGNVPAILMRKLMGKACTSEDEFINVLAGLNVNARVVITGSAVIIALGMGYLPAASYAYAAKNYKRFIKLTFHLIWLSFAWSTFLFIILMTLNKQISGLFGDDDGFIYWSSRILMWSNFARFLVFGQFNTQVILQALGMGRRASIMAIFGQFLSILFFMLILSYLKPNDPLMPSLAFPCSWIFTFLMGLFMAGKPCYDVYKISKEEEKAIEDKNDPLAICREEKQKSEEKAHGLLIEVTSEKKTDDEKKQSL